MTIGGTCDRFIPKETIAKTEDRISYDERTNQCQTITNLLPKDCEPLRV